MAQPDEMLSYCNVREAIRVVGFLPDETRMEGNKRIDVCVERVRVHM